MKKPRNPTLRAAQMQVLRTAAGCHPRVPEYQVLARAAALLMMYSQAEKVRQEEPIGFSPGPPAPGEEEEEEYEDED